MLRCEIELHSVRATGVSHIASYSRRSKAMSILSVLAIHVRWIIMRIGINDRKLPYAEPLVRCDMSVNRNTGDKHLDQCLPPAQFHRDNPSSLSS